MLLDASVDHAVTLVPLIVTTASYSARPLPELA